MKTKTTKPSQGLIVRSTQFRHLKREPPEGRRKHTFQKKTGKNTYSVTTYRNHTKIVTHVAIVETKEQAQKRFKRMYRNFEKQKKAVDFGGSVQRFDGTIKTVRQGKVWLKKDSGVTKSSHIYSIKKTGKKKDRGAELNNKLIDAMDELEKFETRLIGKDGQTEPWRKKQTEKKRMKKQTSKEKRKGRKGGYK